MMDNKELADAMARIEATVATWRRIGEDQRADDMQMLLDALAAADARIAEQGAEIERLKAKAYDQHIADGGY